MGIPAVIGHGLITCGPPAVIQVQLGVEPERGVEDLDGQLNLIG